ncbi:dihydrofolate reductase family protein [Dyadobacter luticola]|uniref:Dihydrofolate reductase n=1 Tax=Dyadobacter luticola TaxID=1979387 RepID=A0A5R9L387_9BACT|nr:dihydrofolate reductase family protein [Dyadobacter luticola]TLV02755.1 dihydrofolate reductase [Dyadobacter luticola]
MRRIIMNEHLTLDGVIQGPGGPDEDTSGGFELGGWSAPFGDEVTGKTVMATLEQPFDLLLGRVTYKIWEPFWPFQSGPIADKFNSIKKYVATQTLTETSWGNTILLNGDTLEQIKELKATDGPDLQIWGSGNFVQTLLQNGLIDQMNIWLYPVVLGKGKRLFEGAAVPGNFKLTKNVVSDKGVIVSTYEADGKVKLGRIAEE